MNNGDPTSLVAATPVLLKPDALNRWSGIVVPLQDEFTFYLMVEKRPDGSVGILLSNPERDFGNLIGVERLTREGNVVKLIGKRPAEMMSSTDICSGMEPSTSMAKSMKRFLPLETAATKSTF